MVMKVVDYKQDNGGFVSDCNGFTLLDQEWTDLNNIRIRDRAVSKIAGEADMLSLDNTPRHSIFLNGYSNNKYYYYIDDSGNTHRINAAGSEADVTKKDSGDNNVPLATGVQYQMSPYLGGYALVVNDGTNTPQYITSVGSGDNTTSLTDLPGWDYSDDFSNISAKVIRPFKYVLVAGGITQTDTDSLVHRNAGTVRVSNQAVAGTLPTWNPDGGDTADEFELAENGEIREMLALQDELMIYTEDDIYGLRLTSSTTSPVQVRKILSGRGILASNCVAEFFGRHFVVGPEDIYLFQSSVAVQSVADGRVREYFRTNLHKTHYENTFVVHNERFDEMWVCFPSTASTGPCDVALIWNYKYNAWTKADLADVYTGSFGPTVTNSAFDFVNTALVLPSSSDDTLKQRDTGTDYAGTNFTAFVEKTGWDYAPDMVNSSKQYPEVYFIMSGSGEVDISFTGTSYPSETVSFTDNNAVSETFDISEDLHLSPRLEGAFYNMRIESTNDDSWSLHRIVIDTEIAFDRST